MLKLYTPKYTDLWFRKLILADQNTMEYNHKYGGTIDFNESKWNEWFSKWVDNKSKDRFYRYLLEEDSNEYVGEVAYRFDEDRKIYIASIIVYFKYRKNGYGKIGLQLLCEAAKTNGIDYLYDDIAIDNKAVNLFINNGFVERYRNDEIIMLKKKL